MQRKKPHHFDEAFLLFMLDRGIAFTHQLQKAWTQ